MGNKKTPLSPKEKLLQATNSDKFRLAFIVISFICLIIIRLISHAFGFSLGYLYLTLICLSGFWFGFRGGLITATISSLIFTVEVSIFRDWPLRDVVVKSMYLRMAFFYVGAIALAYISESDKKLKEKLNELAHYDELTNCINFRWIMEILENEVKRCMRYHKEMAVVMIDIDHFKNINDVYGHQVGNKVLKQFAEAVKNNVRDCDIVGRYGGEEFLIILPEAEHKSALVLLERIKGKISEMQLPVLSGYEKIRPSLHFSAGIAYFPLNGKNIQELINVADRTLYQAKSAGRDRIMAERRRSIRVKPLSSFNAELINTAKQEKLPVTEIINISQGGMLAAVSKEPEGAEFICRIRLSDNEPPIEFNCKIVHKERSNKELYLTGFYFLDIPKEAEKRLKFLFSQST